MIAITTKVCQPDREPSDMHESLNPKFEFLNPKQIQISKYQSKKITVILTDSSGACPRWRFFDKLRMSSKGGSEAE